MIRLSLFLFLLVSSAAYAQYAPQAGMPGSTAVSASDGSIISWATGCTLQRGCMDIANKGLGYTTSGDNTHAIGAADGYIVSLGDSGVAVMTFAHPLYNGPGPDFAIFENGFKDPGNAAMAFLELAFVEVSSDGEHFFRFPATSNTPLNSQIPMAGVYMDASLINNLAGKYIANYGTPFDLQELSGSAGLDIDNITHVRIIDVVGAITGNTSLDNAGHIINDPYPTAIPTGGFDLDAVGVMHMKSVGVSLLDQNTSVSIYPNPATDNFIVSATQNDLHLTITSIVGAVVHQQYISKGNTVVDISQYPAGTYFLTFYGAGYKWVQKLVKR